MLFDKIFKKQLYLGECCDEPYSTTLVTKEPNYPTTIDVKNKPLEQTTDPLKLSRLITPIPSIPSTEYPKLPNTVVPQITNRQIDNNRARPTCVDVSPSCQSINHLCFNVVYQIVMVRNVQNFIVSYLLIQHLVRFYLQSMQFASNKYSTI